MMVRKLVVQITNALLVFTLLFFVSPPDLARAQEHVSIAPSATRSWNDLVQLDAALRVSGETEPRAVPFMTGPGPRVLDSQWRSAPRDLLPDAAHPRQGDPQLDGIPLINPLESFQALPDNNTTIPPDTHGAAGPNHLMTILNSQVRIQNKAGGIISTVSLAAFWAPAGAGSPFDPKVIYDAQSSRWYATCDADANAATSKVFFAVSATNNPTGLWTFYSIVADGTGTTWADYPGFGLNSKWVAITNNMFTVNATPAFVGAKMWVVDKTTVGGALGVTVFNPGFDVAATVSGFTLQPCHTYSAAEPKLYIVDNSGYSTGVGTPFLIRLSELTGTAAAPVWSVTAGSSFAGTGLFAVVAANNFNFAQVNAPQKGSAQLVSTNDPRIINAVHRNGRVWFTHSGGLPVAPALSNRTAALWYQVNPAAMPNPIVQSGVIDGGVGVHHFFPSINANSTNDAALGFSRSDVAHFVEAAYTDRLAADPVSTMRTVKVMKCGRASYFKDFGSGRNRWGDYSATVVDPSDDLSFWFIQEYAELPSGGSDRWGTWWAKLPLPVPPDPAIKPSYVSFSTLGCTVGTTNAELHPEIWCPGNPPKLQYYCTVNVTIGPGLNACDVCDLMKVAVNTDPDCMTAGFTATCSGDVLCVGNTNAAPCPGAFVCFDPVGINQVNNGVDIRFLGVNMPFVYRYTRFAAGSPVVPGPNAISVIHTVRRAPSYLPVTYQATVTPTAGQAGDLIAASLSSALNSQGDNTTVSGQSLTLNPAGGGGDTLATHDLTFYNNDGGIGGSASPVPNLFPLVGVPIPALGPAGLGAIVTLLAGGGAMALRRRRTTSGPPPDRSVDTRGA